SGVTTDSSISRPLLTSHAIGSEAKLVISPAAPATKSVGSSTRLVAAVATSPTPGAFSPPLTVPTTVDVNWLALLSTADVADPSGTALRTPSTYSVNERSVDFKLTFSVASSTSAISHPPVRMQSAGSRRLPLGRRSDKFPPLVRKIG